MATEETHTMGDDTVFIEVNIVEVIRELCRDGYKLTLQSTCSGMRGVLEYGGKSLIREANNGEGRISSVEVLRALHKDRRDLKRT